MEEASIAKGIRRIVAVTGESAYEAGRVALEFQKKVNVLKNLKGSDLESAFKVVNKEVDKVMVSAVRKQLFKDELGRIQKAMTEAEKSRQAEQVHAALEKLGDSLNDEQSAFVVAKFEDMDPKALSALVNHIKTKTKKAAFFINVDKTNDRVAHQCYVPKVCPYIS